MRKTKLTDPPSPANADAPNTALTLAVETPETVILNELRNRGKAVIDSLLDAGNKYYLLCLWIRENQISTKMVSLTLRTTGFARSRISEINRVANLPNNDWEPFAAQAIGFRRALELSRETPKRIVEIIAEQGGITPETLSSKLDTPHDPPATNSKTKALAIHAHRTLKTAAKIKLRPLKDLPNLTCPLYQFSNGNELVLVIFRRPAE